MEITNILYSSLAAQRIIKVHGSAACHKKNMLYAPVCKELPDVIRYSHTLSSLYTFYMFYTAKQNSLTVLTM